MTNSSRLLILFFLIFCEINKAVPLTMGFGKTIKLPNNKDLFQARAFDFNIFPSSGEHFEDPFIRPHHQHHAYGSLHHHQHQHQQYPHHPHHPPQHLLEIDLAFAKKKPIDGVRHLFCSGYYCAFEYAR